MFTHIVCSNWLIDGTKSVATPLVQRGPGSNDNEGVLHVPQSSKIGALPSDGLLSYPGHPNNWEYHIEYKKT